MIPHVNVAVYLSFRFLAAHRAQAFNPAGDLSLANTSA